MTRSPDDDVIDDEDRSPFMASLVEVLGSQVLPSGEMDAFCDAIFKRYGSAARLRPGVSAEQLPFLTRPVPWYVPGRQPVEPTARPSQTLQYAGGEFFLQDAGSMLALAACRADDPTEPNRLVCDLCAAPGGKASALLETIGGGFLLANEPIKSRVAPLAYNLARTGVDRYCVTSLDPQVLAERLGGIFDLVLVDAPCSGQALLGRGKQSIASVSSSQVEHSAMRSRRILSSALELVRPGGELVFSTCTFAEDENENQIRWLIGQHGVEPMPLQRLREYASESTGCGYRVWPHRHECAGSFAASLRRKCFVEPAKRPSRKRKSRRDRVPPDAVGFFDWSTPRCQVAGAVVWGWPEDAPAWVESIATAGPELAYRTGQTWKPSHEAALRRSAGVHVSRRVEVDREKALAFLRGEPIRCGAVGWCVVTHDARPLGWIKASRGIGKNHLPAAARVNW